MSGLNRAAELAKNGQLPVVEVVEGFYTKRELQVYRGWNAYLTRKFLKPDRIRKVMYIWENPEKNWEKTLWTRRYEFEYYVTQVAAIEATPEWQQANARREKKDKRHREAHGQRRKLVVTPKPG